MQVKSWPTPVSAIISNHLWFLRFPSEKQKNASRKNLFRLEAPWPRREIQPWGLSTVTRTLTYGNYTLLYLMEFAVSSNFFNKRPLRVDPCQYGILSHPKIHCRRANSSSMI